MARSKTWDWRAELVGAAKRRSEPFPTISDIELTHIERVLQAYGFNFVHAAKALGISRATLYRKMHRVAGGGVAATPASRKRSRARMRAA